MRIIIAGAGAAGVHLAKTLSSEKFDVVVIDEDYSRLEVLNGYDLLAITDDPLSCGVLAEAGAAKADMFISLLPDDSENLLVCIMAKDLGARCTVARINRDSLATAEARQLLLKKGVDHIVYPEQLAVLEVESALRHPWSRHWTEFCDGQLILAAAVVSADSPLCNLRLKDFGPYASEFHISAITRGRDTIIPNGNTTVHEGDIAYISTIAGNGDSIEKLFGRTDSVINKIMIVGGSRIGEMMARHWAGKYDIMLVEKDRAHATLLSETLPQGIVVAHGDGRSIDFLNSEAVGDFDAYLAFTESSEGNIIGCQIAKEMGVAKTVVKITSIDLVAEAEKLGIKTVVSKNLLCSSRIHQILLNGIEEKCLSMAGADVNVMTIAGNSYVTGGKIKDIKLPAGVTLAGVVREGVGMMVHGNTELRAGDRVVVFMLPGTLLSIKKFFC